MLGRTLTGPGVTAAEADTTMAILIGAEFDAEPARGRMNEAGGDGDAEPYAEPRDTTKINERGDLGDRDRDRDREHAADQGEQAVRSRKPDPAT